MKISTRGRYSLRMMIDLAQHRSDGYITLNDIAKRQDISKKYLEQITPFLTRSELIVSAKGQAGGYALAKEPSEITVKDILLSAEGSLAPVSCMESGTVKCERAAECMTLPIYQGLYKVVSEYLDSITLQSILDNAPESYEYYI